MLLHGYPQTWYMWRKVLPALADQFTVIAPDLRGSGLTAQGPGLWNFGFFTLPNGLAERILAGREDTWVD